jgi:hypothetical protein
MLARLSNLTQGFTRLLRPLQMSTIPKSPISPGSPRAMKRQKLDHEPQEAANHAAQESTQGGFSEAELVEREMGLPIEYERQYQHELDYRNKLVLAPMVRTGSCKYSIPLCGGFKADDSAYGMTISFRSI